MSKVIGRSPRKAPVRSSRARIRQVARKVHRPERPKYLTPQQFLKLPLSQAILQVIEDVKKIRRRGIKIDMSVWWNVSYMVQDPTIPCSVCLGGAAVCSFALEKVNGYSLLEYGRKVLGIGRRDTSKIAFTFDEVRMGNIEVAFKWWYGRRPPEEVVEISDTIYCKYDFRGIADGGWQFKDLLQYLRMVSRTLRKAGY